MKNLSKRLLWLAGILVILLTNGVALMGVAWNRSGDPESQITLTQRELQRPYWGMNRENSGITLRLAWRVAPRDGGDALAWDYPGAGGRPEWLDEAKMESLGFVMATSPADDGDSWPSRQRSREVLLVLEQDGPAYGQALALVRRHAAEEEAKRAANPDSEEFKRRAKQAMDRVGREERENSRLFVVDAGIELRTLRARYPDRSRYAIVRGLVAPSPGGRGQKDVSRGYIDRISTDLINGPFEYRRVFEHGATQGRPDQGAPFAAKVAFGQRLEPWIVEAAPTPNEVQPSAVPPQQPR